MDVYHSPANVGFDAVNSAKANSKIGNQVFSPSAGLSKEMKDAISNIVEQYNTKNYLYSFDFDDNITDEETSMFQQEFNQLP